MTDDQCDDINDTLYMGYMYFKGFAHFSHCHLNEGAERSGHQPLSAKPTCHQHVPKPSTHFL